ncbi:MAG: Rossmann-like domain-containing protein [Cohaesibacteraceae bacterium]
MNVQDAPTGAPSADIGFTDTMPLGSALELLRQAGWSVSKQSGCHAIGIADAAPDALPLPFEAEPELLVDGHRLLRAVGRGGLDYDLASSINSDAIVDDVLVGLNWTMVRAGDLTGIARSPERGTQGARTVREDAPISGRPLRELALWLCSLDPLRRSIGLAAVNAYWNRAIGIPNETYRFKGLDTNGPWGFARFDPPGEGLVIVGGFRGVQKRLPNARIVEREPKGNDIPASDAPEAFGKAAAIAITAQTLMNGSLEPLLHHATVCPRVMLVGPSTPVSPILLSYGFTEVCGLAITDRDQAAQFIKETGTMIALDTMTCQLGLAQ